MPNSDMSQVQNVSSRMLQLKQIFQPTRGSTDTINHRKVMFKTCCSGFSTSRVNPNSFPDSSVLDSQTSWTAKRVGNPNVLDSQVFWTTKHPEQPNVLDTQTSGTTKCPGQPAADTHLPMTRLVWDSDLLLQTACLGHCIVCHPTIKQCLSEILHHPRF